MTTTLYGTVFIHSETGTEGGMYAFNDGATVKLDPFGIVSWGYEGLHVLKDGDHLKVMGSHWASKWVDEEFEDQGMHWSGYNTLWEGECKFRALATYDDPTAQTHGLWMRHEHVDFTLDNELPVSLTTLKRHEFKPMGNADGTGLCTTIEECIDVAVADGMEFSTDRTEEELRELYKDLYVMAPARHAWSDMFMHRNRAILTLEE